MLKRRSMPKADAAVALTGNSGSRRGLETYLPCKNAAGCHDALDAALVKNTITACEIKA